MPSYDRTKNLNTDDMERWRVQLRMTLDREHRRFHKANEIDYFEELLKAKLNERSQQQQQQQQQQGLSLNLTRLDETAFTKLSDFLKIFMSSCPSIEQQNKLHKVLRDLLIELKQELYQKAPSPGCLEPYCLFCGTSIQTRQSISNEPCNPQLHSESYTPNVAAAVTTPPPSAAPTPDEGLHNHSLQRLQSQFNNSFTRQPNGRSATPPLSPSAMAALRLRQNQEAQRAVDDARAAASEPNASPMGLVNLNQQANDDDDDDLEQAEVASVRDIVGQVDRVMSSPVRRSRRSSSPLSSSGSSSDLVMDVSVDASVSQESEPNTPPTRVKKMREQLRNPQRKPRYKKGGPKRNSYRAAN